MANSLLKLHRPRLLGQSKMCQDKVEHFRILGPHIN